MTVFNRFLAFKRKVDAFGGAPIYVEGVRQVGLFGHLVLTLVLIILVIVSYIVLPNKVF